MSITRQITLHCDAPGCTESYSANSDRVREARRQARCACWRYIPARSPKDYWLPSQSPKDYCAICAHLWSTP